MQAYVKGQIVEETFCFQRQGVVMAPNLSCFSSASFSAMPCSIVFQQSLPCIVRAGKAGAVMKTSLKVEKESVNGHPLFDPLKSTPLVHALSLFMTWVVHITTRGAFLMRSLQNRISAIMFHTHFQYVIPHQNECEKLWTRRLALVMPAVAGASLPIASLAVATPAEGSDVASLLQNLGIADADIYYPRFFEGIWNCFSTLIAVETPQGEDKADKERLEFAQQQLGYTVHYKAHFVPFQGKVINDRLLTTVSLIESTVGRNVVDHVIWTPQQPDRLTLMLKGGMKVENFVTRRSFSASAPGQFDTSEYSQQVFDSFVGQGGPPTTVKASQIRTRYRWDPIGDQIIRLEAFQRVAMFLVPNGGAFKDLDVLILNKPITIYKYLLRLERDIKS